VHGKNTFIINERMWQKKHWWRPPLVNFINEAIASGGFKLQRHFWLFKIPPFHQWGRNVPMWALRISAEIQLTKPYFFFLLV
jgi:hypothetical protein